VSTEFHPNNRYITKSLFVETNLYPDRKKHIRYSLKDKDKGSIPSLKRLYMEAEDPLEYDFANTYFENYEHWETLCECEWFKPHVERWRKELDIKLRAKSLKRIIEEAQSGKKEAYSANKYLLEKGYLPRDEQKSRGVGRPSKESIKQEAERLFRQSESVDDDLQRLKLN
jgi:hypothetical protein